MEFLRYLLLATLYLSPFFLLERAFRSSFRPRIAPYWWARLFLLLLLQSITLALLSFYPLHTEILFGTPFLHVNDLRDYWSSMPPAFSGFCAFLIFTFVHYWTHVARHRVPFLWKWCHRLHHSSERFETYVSLYIHPFELILLQLTFAAVLFFSGFGLKTLGAFGFFYIFINAWMHMNVESPQWLGYVVFRPEQHSRHHSGQECNYGVIPLWDLVFGTFENPKRHPEIVGFKSDDGKKFWSYLLGR
jgi:sterol desaturase/sphingolipid hydroxylase (fatty acid hydroxylase superfamily)